MPIPNQVENNRKAFLLKVFDTFGIFPDRPIVRCRLSTKNCFRPTIDCPTEFCYYSNQMAVQDDDQLSRPFSRCINLKVVKKERFSKVFCQNCFSYVGLLKNGRVFFEQFHKANIRTDSHKMYDSCENTPYFGDVKNDRELSALFSKINTVSI